MKKAITVVFCFFLVWNLLAGTYSGGSGTSGAPYQISTLNDLSELCQTTADWSKFFILMNNIDATNTQSWDDTDDNTDGNLYNDPNDGDINGDNNGWCSIGTNVLGFTGTFDGNGFIISHLSSNRPSEYRVGFFGYLSKATVMDLGITSVLLVGRGYVGALAGSASRATISNCYSSGIIEASDTFIGGLVGITSGHTDSPVGLIENCHSSCFVISDYNFAGGLVGRNGNKNQIINSYATGNVVSEQGDYIGGLVGENNDWAKIYQCYATGSITGDEFLGGLVGYNNIQSWIMNCYSLGNVHVSTESGTSASIGGFCGRNFESNIRFCYSTGSVFYDNPSFSDPDGKGFLGTKDNVVGSWLDNNFFDVTASNQTHDATDVALGKATIEMVEVETFTDLSSTGLDFAWDFVGNPNNDASNNNYWNIIDGVCLPFLSWQQQDITWNGSINSDWDEIANWTNIESLPNISSNVIIPGGVPNNPVIATGMEASCRVLTVNSGGHLTIASGGSLITSGNIVNNGTIHVQHSMTNGHWHLVSSPVEGATASVFSGDFLQYFDETLAENNYIEITSGATPLNSCKGYSWRNFSKDNFTFSGTPHTGNQSIATTKVHDYGWNLLGNPYPSSIDWDILKGTYGAVYTFVDNGVNSGWAVYNNGGVNGGSRYLAPMQGFFIATNAPGTFNAKNAARTHEDADGYVKSSKQLENYVKLAVSANSLSDELFIQLGENYLEGFELIHDAWKMGSESNEYLILYSKTADGNLCMDRRPECPTIQLGIKYKANIQASISVIESADLPYIQLEDTKLNQFHNLSNGAYSFDWNPADSEERFILHLKATGTNDLEAQAAQVYSAGNRVYVHLSELNSYSEMAVYDMRGRVIVKKILTATSLQSFELNQPSGAYLVQLIGTENSKSYKIVL